jgi:hypothetical protein
MGATSMEKMAEKFLGFQGLSFGGSADSAQVIGMLICSQLIKFSMRPEG